MRTLIFCLALSFAACTNADKQSNEIQGEVREDLDADVTQSLSYAVNEFEGEYRLQSLFRAEGECLDANYDDSDTGHRGAYMAPCNGSGDQTWRFTPTEDGHHYQISSMHGGEKVCLDGNDTSSVIHSGAAFAETCRSIAGQIWSLAEEENGAFRLHTEYLEHGYCLESNSADYPQHSGASYMDACQNVSGQFWRLVRLDAPARPVAQASAQANAAPLHNIHECEQGLRTLAHHYYEYPENPNAARPDHRESFAGYYEKFQGVAREHCPRVGAWVEQTMAAGGQADAYQRMLAEHSENELYPGETLTGWQDYFDGKIGIINGSERLMQQCPQNHKVSFDCETVTERTRLRIEQVVALLEMASSANISPNAPS